MTNEVQQRQRRARIFVRLLEAKHSLEALEQLLSLPDDKQCAAGLIAQVQSFKAELQGRLTHPNPGNKVQQSAADQGQGA